VNYIFITRECDPLPIADRLQDEGKEVVIGRIDEGEPGSKDRDECRKQLYDGILDIHDAEDVLKWMEPLKNKEEWFVMMDYGDLWEYSERALKMGFTKGLFPTKEGYDLEDDRQKGKEFARKNFPNLKVAPVNEFTKVADAIKFLNEQKDKIFVLKSEGSNCETVVPNTPDADLARRQIIGALLSEKADYEKGLTLEEKIQNAIELSPVMVFWDGKPLYSVVELENKHLGSGGIGRLTGGCQNLTIRTPFDCELNRVSFPPIVYEMAKKQPGLGIYDAGLLFDGKQFVFTEFCSLRYGWDGVFSQIAMSGDQQHHNAASNHFELMAQGKNPLHWRYGAAVRGFQTEPSPKKTDCYQDSYGVDWLNSASDSLFFYCIRQEETDGEKRFVSVGYRRDLLAATGAADNASEAVDLAYKAIEGAAMTGLYYRPKFDMKSPAYFSSIWNRLDFLSSSGLIE
jgi:phosphoribosylamine-glycine ligase